ncbi:hypothetical protein RchiOBHm_Chr2g0119551 [Rosa chinensis]|uniref:Uncharacterized protein n=1 Tax=Rosa chinensis TaxID=74649 RepID=A0A2P6RS13_ROSCH|nr:hypothetical protein RchiOBHm_Chr2g0119551 [Rosa chinensis]
MCRVMEVMKILEIDLESGWILPKLFQWERKANHFYTQKDIDQVPAEWAKYVSQFQQS